MIILIVSVSYCDYCVIALSNIQTDANVDACIDKFVASEKRNIFGLLVRVSLQGFNIFIRGNYRLCINFY